MNFSLSCLATGSSSSSSSIENEVPELSVGNVWGKRAGKRSLIIAAFAGECAPILRNKTLTMCGIKNCLNRR